MEEHSTATSPGKAHVAANEASRLSSLAMQQIRSPIFIFDEKHRVAVASRPAARLLGYDYGDLIGCTVDSVLTESALKHYLAYVDAFFARPEIRPVELDGKLSLRHKDGSEIKANVRLASLPGLPAAMLMEFHDEQKFLPPESLRDALAAIVGDSDDAILSKTLDGTILTWNPGAERLFGYSPDEIIGQSVYSLVPEQCSVDEAGILARVRNNERVRHFETRRRCKDGTELEVSVTLSPIRNGAGQVVAASSIVRDITEARRRDAELRRSNAELEQFAYVASHDLQEPLRMVANYTELLAERYRGRLDDKADLYIKYASGGARRMQKLVSDLLTYSRNASQDRAPDRVSTRALVAEVLQSMQSTMENAGASVQYGELPDVLGDEGQLWHVFQNLIDNAIKFRSEAAPRIVIAAVSSGSHVTFSVTDNGIGLDMKHADQLFQMFRRLHDRDKYEGSGIGLALVRRIVERHGGTVWVESAPGAGATFSFTLPAVPDGLR